MGPEGIKKPRTGAAPITSRHATVRCLVAVVNYHDAGETAEASAVMSAEIRNVVTLCGDRRLPPSEFVTSVLYPPRNGLAYRYGSDCGGRLFAAFLTTFLATADAANDTL